MEIMVVRRGTNPSLHLGGPDCLLLSNPITCYSRLDFPFRNHLPSPDSRNDHMIQAWPIRFLLWDQ